MGLFGKKESNEEYRTLRDSLFDEWNHLLSDNPYETAEKMKQKWTTLSYKANNVYKLSKKYKDTENDIPKIKTYVDDINNRISEYSFEIDYKKFKNEFSSVLKEYEELLEERYSGSGIWNDYYELMTRYEKLRNRTEWLLRQLPTYSQYDIDERLVIDINSNTAFYYCASILWLTENKENERDQTRRDLYYQCLRKSEAVAKQFTEGRFKVIKGVACNRRALFNEAYENMCGSNDRSVINSLLREAKPFLSIVESPDYCYAVAKKHTGYSTINDWEWKFMINATTDLCIIYQYEGNLQRARTVVNVMIEALQKANVLGNYSDLINSLIEFRNGII